MKITVSNIVEQYPKLNILLPKELNQDEFEFIKENIDLYSEDDTIKKYIDTFVNKLNEFASKKEESPGRKQKPSPAQKTEKKVEAKKETGKQKPARKTTNRNAKPKPEPHIVPVEHFMLEERFIKRYLLLDGKVKTRDQLLNFIKALQRAITEKKIRKTSKYADIIVDIQNNLVSTYNALPEKMEGIKFTLVPKKAEELKKLVGDKKVRLSVTYIKRFIGLYGKETKEKVERLQKLINNAIEKGKIQNSDPYITQLKTVQKALDNYLLKDDIKIKDSELRGLAGIAGASINEQSTGNPFESTDVVSSLDLKKAVFRHMGFTGIWKKIIGDPEEPFHIMIYGPGGKGKSTFGIKFATYLSKELLRKVLYVADEEKISNKLKDKLQLFNAYNQNLSVTGKMPVSIKGHEIVFLDSVTSMGMEPEELEEIQEQYPQSSFVYILQTNKQGSFYGKKKWEHLCDVVLRFEDGVVNVEKNRFGKVGEYEVYKQTVF
jgi:signal recognition particle GTPase